MLCVCMLMCSLICLLWSSCKSTAFLCFVLFAITISVDIASCVLRLFQLHFFARYLNFIGEIIFLNLDQGLDERIIIDPQWFCSTVIGKLAEPNEWLPEEMRVGASAIVSRKFLLKRLQLDRISAGGVDLAVVALEQLLLIEKVVEQPNHYIVPVLLEGDNGAGLADWSKCKDLPVVVGRRFECRNEHDALGPGFFPKLQVALSRLPYIESVRMGQGTICLVANSCSVFVGLAKDMRSKWFHYCIIFVCCF